MIKNQTVVTVQECVSFHLELLLSRQLSCSRVSRKFSDRLKFADGLFCPHAMTPLDSDGTLHPLSIKTSNKPLQSAVALINNTFI